MVIIFPSTIYDGCNGIVLGTTTKKYKIQKDCSKISRKGVECCSSSGNSKIGYYYPDNIAKTDLKFCLPHPLSASSPIIIEANKNPKRKPPVGPNRYGKPPP